MAKIIHLGYTHKIKDTRIFEKECKALAKQGNEVAFITSNRNGDYNGGLEDNIQLKTLPLKNIRVIRLLLYIYDLKKECLELDGDVYHIHEPYLIPLVKPLKKRSKIVIYDKHENTYHGSKKRLSDRFGKVIGTFLAKKFAAYEKKWINKCDGYIYVTPQNEISDIKCPSALIPNFPKLVEQDLKENVTGFDIDKKDFKLCYCGGVSPIWSLLEITEAINEADFEDISFEIAGPGGNDYIDKIKEADTGNKSVYLGKIPFEDVKEVYKNGHVGMAVLKKELGGRFDIEGTLANTKIYEYMQQSIPVIYTNFSIWREMGEEYKFGIAVNPYDKKELIAAVKYLFDNRDEAKKMGCEGKRAVLEKYNWQQYENTFFELYKAAMKGKFFGNKDNLK